MPKNKRQNRIQEATGVRVVQMFVKEFFGWGWVPNEPDNDDGLDGLIHVRDNFGNDLGARIHVQIKSGPSYFKGIDVFGRIKLQPYSSKKILKERLATYAKQVEPTILIYVTSKWDGKTDMYRPWAWWVRVDNYEYDDSSYVYIDKTRRFGEHSKKELFNLVNHTLKWTEYCTIKASSEDYKLFNTVNNLKLGAKTIYDKLRGTNVHCPAFNTNVAFNQIGWRHICNGNRGQSRMRNSFGLMSIVPKVISSSVRWIFARKSPNANDNHVFYTLRSNVLMKKELLKVQVIVRRQTNPKGESKYVFYSVHIMNK